MKIFVTNDIAVVIINIVTNDVKKCKIVLSIATTT